MKFIIIYAEGFSDKIMVVDEPNDFDGQNRMSFFNEFYNIKDKPLSFLDFEELNKLENKIYYFLDNNLRKNILSKIKISKFHHIVKKTFLDKDYELYVIEDRLAILGIDLYNINIYAKSNNTSIQYKTANTRKDFSRLIITLDNYDNKRRS